MNRFPRIVSTTLILVSFSILLGGANIAESRPLDLTAAQGEAALRSSFTERFSAAGEMVFFGVSVPATWHYDLAQRKMLIEISISATSSSWALLDWSSTKHMGYVGREDHCSSFALQKTPLPTPDRLNELAAASQVEALEPHELAPGLSLVKRDTTRTALTVREDNAALIFSFEKVAPAATPKPLKKDVSQCRPIDELIEVLRTGGRASVPAEDAQAASLLQYNHRYKFRGLIYGSLEYKGRVFSQNKAEYDGALAACQAAGPDECKPYWVTGGWFGRYGYHCGDGWGRGQSKWVSGQDYCCYMHDRQEWGGDQAKNLCGFAACMTCKYYTSLPDWETNFRGDFWAQKAIAGYVAVGISAILCHPQSYITGFTCG